MRSTLAGVMIVCTVLVAALQATQLYPHAEGLVVRSTIEVTAIPIEPSPLAMQLAMSVSPYRISPGRAEVVTRVLGEAVRVEGMGARLGLPDDVVLITTPDGAIVGLRPERREWFRLPVLSEAMRKTLFREWPARRQSGGTHHIGDVVTRKFTRSLVGEMQALDRIERTWDPRTDRLVEVWTLPDTPEERTARFWSTEMANRRAAERRREVPVVVERWEVDGYGDLGSVLANASLDIDSLATFQLSDGGDESFALRQVVVNPTTGRRVEVAVDDVARSTLDASQFEVPVGFTRVPPPLSIASSGGRDR